MPFTTISWKIRCKDVLSLFASSSSPASLSITFPTSVSYYQDDSLAISSNQTGERGYIDYISFLVPNDSSLGTANCVGLARGFMHSLKSVKKGCDSLEATLPSVPDGYNCGPVFI
ncbi:hypothetical protein SLA2020_420070 [Shorea laevis]